MWAAWGQNQYHCGVHKYVALSQMKMGDMSGAKKSITRSVLHQEQWNEENLKENKEDTRELHPQFAPLTMYPY